MNSPGLGCDLEGTARRLAAAARGPSAQLRRELSRAQTQIDRVSRGRRQVPAGDDERVELLGAVVQAMRRGVARSSRQGPSGLEGTEVHVRLLEHLARPPRYLQPQQASLFPSATEPSPAPFQCNSLARAL
jgi:hypothetical protein